MPYSDHGSLFLLPKAGHLYLGGMDGWTDGSRFRSGGRAYEFPKLSKNLKCELSGRKTFEKIEKRRLGCTEGQNRDFRPFFAPGGPFRPKWAKIGENRLKSAKIGKIGQTIENFEVLECVWELFGMGLGLDWGWVGSVFGSGKPSSGDRPVKIAECAFFGP